LTRPVKIFGRSFTTLGISRGVIVPGGLTSKEDLTSPAANPVFWQNPNPNWPEYIVAPAWGNATVNLSGLLETEAYTTLFFTGNHSFQVIFYKHGIIKFNYLNTSPVYPAVIALKGPLPYQWHVATDPQYPFLPGNNTSIEWSIRKAGCHLGSEILLPIVSK